MPPEQQQPLNVIALVSGGKDSFFSLLHSLAHGHRIVALANLYPATTTAVETHDASGDLGTPKNLGTPDDFATLGDLNSYMYQTAGHALIPLYAQALPYPLYRQHIAGTAKDQGREYAGPGGPPPDRTGIAVAAAAPVYDEDETESLLPLLRRVLAEHPDANALCTGAILSTYQRTRVESVCSRLGLISLAYLWQYPVLPRAVLSSEESSKDPEPASPDALLEDIAAANLDARIVKVASAGLDESFLWESLANPKVRSRVRRAVSRFGGSPLGEGGEFETLVVSGPPAVWAGRLEVEDHERVVVEGGGGEASLAFKGGKVLMNGAGHSVQDVKQHVRIPALWDHEFYTILRELDGFVSSEQQHQQQSELATRGFRDWQFYPQVTRTQRSLHIANLTGTRGTTLADRTTAICAELQIFLAENSLQTSDIVSTTILLRSIQDFGRINSIYSQLFSEPIPPARVTVAVGDAMPDGADVAFSVTASYTPRTERRGLHVQSRSYWAPANIGPYSQAVNVNVGESGCNALVYVAGQIPLIPASMDVLQPATTSDWSAFCEQAVLSAQHLWRIGSEMNVSWWTGAVAFLTKHDECASRARLAGHIWKRLHQRTHDGPDAESELTGPDLWDRQYGGMGSYTSEAPAKRRIPDFEALKAAPNEDAIPAFIAVEIHDTPRSCSIEWQSLGLTGSGLEFAMDRNYSALGTDSTQTSSVQIHFHQIDASATENEVESCLKTYGLWDDSEASRTQRPAMVARKVHSATLYTSQPSHSRPALVQCVPCPRLWASDGRELQAAVVVVIET